MTHSCKKLASKQLGIHTLVYSSDSSSLFARFRHLPAAVFLDSSAPFSEQGRYDIISAAPIKLLQCPRAIFQNGESFFQHLHNELDAAIAIRESTESLPFIGGAIGFFSYDLGRELEKFPQQAIDDVSLPDAIVGIYDWAIVVDHQLQKTTLVTQPSIDQQRLETLKTIIDTPEEQSDGFHLKNAFHSNMSPHSYREAFEKSHHYIEAGDCYQINLAQRFSATYSGDTWQAYKRLRETAAAPYSAYMKYDGCEILCLSPEQFIQLRGGHVTTAPIKGTRPRGETPQRDEQLAMQLQASHKDQAENLMIVDLLRNDIGKCCRPGSVHVDKLFELQSFETVHHLVSTISGELEADKHPCDILAACFPGGSITGAPKVRAMEIIEELEPHRRSIYCGSMAYISFDGQMDSNIAIRTFLADRGHLHCWSGGGLVADSSCEGEYQESLSKVGKLLQALGDNQFSG